MKNILDAVLADTEPSLHRQDVLLNEIVETLHSIQAVQHDLQKHVLDLKRDSLTIRRQLDTIESVLSITKEKIDTDVVEQCQKMGSHIDFVETVYDNVKHPLNFVCENINYIANTALSSTGKRPLPRITNEPKNELNAESGESANADILDGESIDENY